MVTASTIANIGWIGNIWKHMLRFDDFVSEVLMILIEAPINIGNNNTFA